ncbi:MAG: protein phosphatase [Desulfobacterales bacterium]|nr:MAG: protein phosphatase [Desulfobacterales bacterium]
MLENSGCMSAAGKACEAWMLRRENEAASADGKRRSDMIMAESAGLTDVGMKRRGNEDALFFSDELGLYMVADGMGGHQAGEVASAMVVDTFREYMQRYKDPEAEDGSRNSGDTPDLIDPGAGAAANRLLRLVRMANRAVYEAAVSRPELKGMGSTLTTVLFSNDTIIALNVGDSPLYLIRAGQIDMVSVPHTVLAEQMAMGRKGSERLAREYGHMLTRAMGVEAEVRPDYCELPCLKNDIYVLASDGLSNKVDSEEIMEIALAEKPEKACRMLVDMANERGGEDNITVIIVRVRRVRKVKKKNGNGFWRRLFFRG